MKKRILSLVSFLLTALICFAQPPNKQITFNFESPTYPGVIHIKPKQSVELIFQNINPYLYEITVKDSLLVFPNQQPAQFGQIFKLPELTNVPTAAPPADPAVDGGRPLAASRAAKFKAGEVSIQSDLETYISGYARKVDSVRNVLGCSKIADDLADLLNNCRSTLTALTTIASNFIIAKFPALNSAGLPIDIQTQVESMSASARAGIEQYMARGEVLKTRYLTVLENGTSGMTIEEYKSVEKAIREKIGIIDKVLENSKKLLEKLDAFDTEKVGAAIASNYEKVLTSRVTKPFISSTLYSTDELLLKVNVKKKKDIACPLEIANFPVSCIVKGGVKIDFSTGFIFNIGQNKFFEQKYHYDSVYRTDNVIADSVKIKRNKNNNVLVPSLGAFFHVYSRWASHINIGGLVGASIGTDERVYYHVGGCFLIGKSDRLIIGFGASVSKAKMLDGQFSEDQIFKRSLAPETIATEEPIRVGGFVSVTWNLNVIK